MQIICSYVFIISVCCLMYKNKYCRAIGGNFEKITTNDRVFAESLFNNNPFNSTSVKMQYIADPGNNLIENNGTLGKRCVGISESLELRASTLFSIKSFDQFKNIHDENTNVIDPFVVNSNDTFNNIRKALNHQLKRRNLYQADLSSLGNWTGGCGKKRFVYSDEENTHSASNNFDENTGTLNELFEITEDPISMYNVYDVNSNRPSVRSEYMFGTVTNIFNSVTKTYINDNKENYINDKENGYAPIVTNLTEERLLNLLPTNEVNSNAENGNSYINYMNNFQNSNTSCSKYVKQSCKIRRNFNEANNKPAVKATDIKMYNALLGFNTTGSHKSVPAGFIARPDLIKTVTFMSRVEPRLTKDLNKENGETVCKDATTNIAHLATRQVYLNGSTLKRQLGVSQIFVSHKIVNVKHPEIIRNLKKMDMSILSYPPAFNYGPFVSRKTKLNSQEKPFVNIGKRSLHNVKQYKPRKPFCTMKNTTSNTSNYHVDKEFNTSLNTLRNLTSKTNWSRNGIIDNFEKSLPELLNSADEIELNIIDDTGVKQGLNYSEVKISPPKLKNSVYKKCKLLRVPLSKNWNIPQPDMSEVRRKNKNTTLIETLT